MAPLDILSIGSISIDFIESGTYFGGTAANVAVNCARLGLATGLYSAASSSDWGKRYIDFLRAEDVPFMHPPDILENLPEYHASLESDGTIKEMVFFDMFVVGYPDMEPAEKKMRPLEEMLHYDDCGIEDFRTEEQVKGFFRR